VEVKGSKKKGEEGREGSKSSLSKRGEEVVSKEEKRREEFEVRSVSRRWSESPYLPNTTSLAHTT
jgi:hypothetical protein